jgi:hypothetical protein
MVVQLNEFKQRLAGGGARSNLFQVNISTWKGSFEPTDRDAEDFLVEAASLPASNIGVIEVPFRGRRLKIAGDRTFEPWTMTVINDATFSIRNGLESWMNLINDHIDATGAVNPVDYASDVVISQLAKNGSVIKGYTLRNAWPSDLSAIDVSYAAENEIERFTCTWQYDYWEATQGVITTG